jgi:hypothetical protein
LALRVGATLQLQRLGYSRSSLRVCRQHVYTDTTTKVIILNDQPTIICSGDSSSINIGSVFNKFNDHLMRTASSLGMRNRPSIHQWSIIWQCTALSMLSHRAVILSDDTVRTQKFEHRLFCISIGSFSDGLLSREYVKVRHEGCLFCERAQAPSHSHLFGTCSMSSCAVSWCRVLSIAVYERRPVLGMWSPHRRLFQVGNPTLVKSTFVRFISRRHYYYR